MVPDEGLIPLVDDMPDITGLFAGTLPSLSHFWSLSLKHWYQKGIQWVLTYHLSEALVIQNLGRSPNLCNRGQDLCHYFWCGR